MKILFFDLETTGLPISWKESYLNTNNWPYIIQLAYIESSFKKEIPVINDIILEPNNFEIPQDSILIHNISNEKAIIEGQDRKEVLENFAHILEGFDYVVAHNISYDINVLRCEFYRNDIKDPFINNIEIFCTMKESTDYCKIPSQYGDYKWPSLQELYFRIFNKNFEGVHNAKFDIKATYECFWELVNLKIFKINFDRNKKNVLSNAQIKLKQNILENKENFLILLSYYYPFSEFQLSKYKDFLCWESISENRNIKWSVEMIVEFKDKIIFSSEALASGPNFDDVYDYGLNYNYAIKNNFDIINHFENEWKNFNALFDFGKLRTVYFVLDKYYDKLNFESLSHLDWPTIILNRFKNDFNWKILSLFSSLSEGQIVKFKEYIHWDELSGNKNIDFTIELINSFKNKWEWSSLTGNIKLSYEYLSNFKEFLDWEKVSYNLTNDDLNLLEFQEFVDYLNWEILSKNYSFTFDFLKEFEYKINWELIQASPNIKWTVKIINEFKNLLNPNQLNLINSNWNVQLITKYKSYLTNNLDVSQSWYSSDVYLISWKELSCGGINYSTKYYRFHEMNITYSHMLIMVFKEFWDWRALSLNNRIKWSVDMIRTFEDKLDFKALSSNKSVEWSKELIAEFYDYWDFRKLLDNENIIWSKHLPFSFLSTDEPFEKINIDDVVLEEIYRFNKEVNSPLNLMEESYETSPLYRINSLLNDDLFDDLIIELK